MKVHTISVSCIDFGTRHMNVKLYQPIGALVALLTILGATCAFFAACNQPFDPRGSFKEQLAIYCMLSTDRNQQFVRVEKTYMPSDYDEKNYSLDNAVRNALVRIQPSPAFQLRDTLLTRSDSGRYNFSISTNVLSPFTPARGRSYLVSASAPALGAPSASVTVPDVGMVHYPSTTTLVLDNPATSKPDAPLIFYARLSWASATRIP